MSGRRCFSTCFICPYGILSGGGILFLTLRREQCNDVSQTLNSKPSKKVLFARTGSDTSLEEADIGSDIAITPDESDKPPPLRSVLTKPVLITVANYSMLAFLGAVLESCIPLVWSTPVQYGGLDLSPASIGFWMSLFGGMNGIFQFSLFPHFARRLGLQRVFVSSVISCAAILIIFPVENLAVVVGGGPNVVAWLFIILQLLSYCFFDSGYRKFLFL